MESAIQQRSFQPASKATFSGSLLIAAILFLDSGVPILLLHLGSFTVGRLITAGIMLLGVFMPLLRRKKNFALRSIWDFAPALLFTLIIVESTISNVLIFKYGWMNFAPSLYLIFPILLFYALKGLNVSTGDILWGFIFAAVITALIVVFDSFSRIDALLELRRMSVFGEQGNTNRLVFLKDACVIAAVILIADLLSNTGLRWLVAVRLPLLALICFPIFVTFESRFSILTVIIATGIYVLTGRLGSVRRFSLSMTGLVIGLPVAWLVIQKFVAPMLTGDFEDYARANNVSVRIDSLNYYYSAFLETYGIGVGHMSTSSNYSNLLSQAVDRAFNLNDLGIYAALFQFGIVGLIFVLAMSLYLIVALFKLGNSAHPRAAALHILGGYTIASMLQVVPFNFFTLSYTCIYGSFLWYIMRRARWELTGS